ncbi:Metallopeptidase [Labilithrix luteola]|uniref:Metallopeptidase n=1 Tax=Labilithrix luteola TaxID=1391654 RepID=A0A0K1Q1Q0_9BACT|nr:M13 family metallopeptidase [Labilithrix luteola]AKU99314.1 Metallopeptidase [Labilithrix luteola]
MRRSLALLSLAAAPFASLVFFACGGGDHPPAAPSSPPVTAASASQLTAQAGVVASSGVERSAMDPSVPACEDFYQYACGSWIKSTEIPADEASWYRSFSVIRDRNEDILRNILETYARGEKVADTAYGKALGDFYGACMDETNIDKLGTKPLDPTLKAIDAIKDPASLAKFLGKMQAEGQPMVFELMASQDFNDATRVIAMLWQGGLGMPEREYYLDSSPKMAELRTKYEQHVAAMLQLAGEPEAKAKASAKTVMKVETMLAKAWMSKEDRREPKKINHPAPRIDLAKSAPGIPWDAWLEGAEAKNVGNFNVAQPDFLKEVGAMINGKVSLADWKTYLRWNTFRGNADELPAPFVDERFKWRKTLVGAQSLPPRWKRCVRTIDGAMGEALAQPFVKKTLGAEGKSTVVGMVQAIEGAMHGNLETLAWMDEPTRKAAFAKLGKIANKIAYPDKWRSYDGLNINRDEYLANTQRASAFEYRRQLAKIGKPVDRYEWQMSPPTVNAYYDAQLNEMVFPAGILQPPFYSNTASMPANYGGIGMVMGHELTHGFDDEGRQFDAEGNLKDWWSKAVDTEFERRASCVQKQFDDYVVLGDLHVNGKLTLGENIADLGGVKLAHRAMKAKASSPAPAGATGKSEFTPEQEFFLGFAQGWCGKLRDEALRHLVSTNPHSPPNLRVNGPLSNLPEFAQAFACQPDSKMVKKDRCEVW